MRDSNSDTLRGDCFLLFLLRFVSLPVSIFPCSSFNRLHVILFISLFSSLRVCLPFPLSLISLALPQPRPGDDQSCTRNEVAGDYQQYSLGRIYLWKSVLIRSVLILGVK